MKRTQDNTTNSIELRFFFLFCRRKMQMDCNIALHNVLQQQFQICVHWVLQVHSDVITLSFNLYTHTE